MNRFLIILWCAIPAVVFCQKKPLDHTVYDGWQSLGEKMISNNGKFVVYTINPQEGDGVLVIQNSDNSFKKEIPRGANPTITEDNQFVIFKIKPFFKETREAKIKKKKPEEMPKDSLGIFEIGSDAVLKIARVKSYKTPEKGSGWLAYLLEKPIADPGKPVGMPDSLTSLNNLLHRADSLQKVADSLRNKSVEARTKGLAVLQNPKKESKEVKPPADLIEEGTDLQLRNLLKGTETTYKLVNEYYFSKNGNALIVETSAKNNDALSKARVLWVHTDHIKTDTVLQQFNDAKNYALDESGSQLAFVAERDSVNKAIRKYYKLWYYKPGMDSAMIKLEKNNAHTPQGMTISPDYANQFSRDGKKLFFGFAPVRIPKDSSLVDFETARLDVWHYKDDYLQPQQLVQLNNELKRSYLAVLYPDNSTIVPLADENCESVVLADEGNGKFALGKSTKGYRIQQQWEQAGIASLYAINTGDGTRKLIKNNLRASESISPNGKYILWYDWKQKNWFTYNNETGAVQNITKNIRVPLYDEEDDHPDDPPPHGSMGWQEGDRFVYIYDKYDIWKLDPSGLIPGVNFTMGTGRKNKLTYRMQVLNEKSRFIADTDLLCFIVFDNVNKKSGLAFHNMSFGNALLSADLAEASYRVVEKAKQQPMLLFTTESFAKSPDLYVAPLKTSDKSLNKEAFNAVKLSATNPQQQEYNWLSVELHRWKMFNGKESEGLLYKPENFDSTKQYPVIFYFYERDADTRYSYITPQPVRASINIPYFVSNGYIVFDPNIYYKTGQPGEDAYNSVGSAARYLHKFKWIDTTKMGIQGHSWGGYQVAYLVTRTNMFAAAEAGAPVANMTSAYGGIRWGTGISRQFQYEHSQTRLGASLWQNKEVFIKNSPLFRADKVNTPLLMMHNDLDGAVPWYQGIEYFSALRRLGKKVWMMQYNGEDHGLVERRNRKDWSIRLGQFFGYYLKGEKPAKWITDGVPATLKCIDWGLKE